MPYFNVVRPGVVAGKHYLRPTSQPIGLDDDVAASVEDGVLEPYPSLQPSIPSGTTAADAAQKHMQELGRAAGQLGRESGDRLADSFDDEPPTEPSPARRRRKAD